MTSPSFSFWVGAGKRCSNFVYRFLRPALLLGSAVVSRHVSGELKLGERGRDIVESMPSSAASASTSA
jgi:hypothetical protein